MDRIIRRKYLSRNWVCDLKISTTFGGLLQHWISSIRVPR